MAHFLYFLLMTAENQSQFGKIFQLIQNILLAHLDNAMDYWFLSHH